MPAGLRGEARGREELQYWNESGRREGVEGCVSMTGINVLIMYLAVLAVVKRVKGTEARGKGVDSMSQLVKSKLGAERRGLVCRAKCCK